MPVVKETARLLQVAAEDVVEKIDALLSLSIAGGNFDWL